MRKLTQKFQQLLVVLTIGTLILMAAVLTPAPAMAQGECQYEVELLAELGVYGFSGSVKEDCSMVLYLPPVEEAAPAEAVPVAETEEAVPAGGDSTCAEISFKDYAGLPYELIAVLDQQPAKVDQPSDEFALYAEETLIYWTGAYVGKWPLGFNPKVLDGRTGVFCIEEGTALTVNYVGAYMPAHLFNPDLEVIEVDGLPSGNAPAETFVEMLNELYEDTSAMVRWLDSWVNVEGAPELDGRFRSTPDGPAEYTSLEPASVVIWVKTGEIAGQEGVDYVTLSNDGASGFSVYLIATDRATITHAHTGVQLDRAINPTCELVFWGDYGVSCPK